MVSTPNTTPMPAPLDHNGDPSWECTFPWAHGRPDDEFDGFIFRRGDLRIEGTWGKIECKHTGCHQGVQDSTLAPVNIVCNHVVEFIQQWEHRVMMVRCADRCALPTRVRVPMFMHSHHAWVHVSPDITNGAREALWVKSGDVGADTISSLGYLYAGEGRYVIRNMIIDELKSDWIAGVICPASVHKRVDEFSHPTPTGRKNPPTTGQLKDLLSISHTGGCTTCARWLDTDSDDNLPF
jgi:hypothetical protein